MVLFAVIEMTWGLFICIKRVKYVTVKEVV